MANDFLSPGFLLGSGESLPQIHEESDQVIQGGTTDEHYHLTEDEHTWASLYAALPFRYEPVSSITSELMFASVGADAGDVMMAPVTGY